MHGNDGRVPYIWRIFDHPSLSRSLVYRGFLRDDTQQAFFDELFALDFRRSLFQEVYHGQSAGLRGGSSNNFFRCDVRFYTDGMIDCEVARARHGYVHLPIPEGREVLEGLLHHHMEHLTDGVRRSIVSRLVYFPHHENA
ncbi:hypothetical protein COV20_01705 [Candidatus Woesearchaeota archaeon CG10_big_fil_rev_8_21_14_0_10_45_16]|nr:MAG: hypothetical protein COV20_01705 [Candidatus Woesearchaeota archaeon CG10_big_fil_rev_8_21_14_0_10_45_16]